MLLKFLNRALLTATVCFLIHVETQASRPELPKTCSQALTFLVEKVLPNHVSQKTLTRSIQRRMLDAYVARFDPMTILLLEDEVQRFTNRSREGLAELWNTLLEDNSQEFDEIALSAARAFEEVQTQLANLTPDQIRIAATPESFEKLRIAWGASDPRPKTIAQREEKLLFFAADFYQTFVGKNEDPEVAAVKTIQALRRLIADSAAPPNTPSQVHEILNAFLETLDPNSRVGDETRSSEDKTKFSATRVGVGIRYNTYLELDPIPNGPAEKAGLRQGDIITHLDGINVEFARSSVIHSLFDGKKGTQVKVTVNRGQANEKQVLDFIVTRQSLSQMSYDPKSVDIVPTQAGNVGVLRFPLFYANSARDVKDHILELKRQSIRGLVLDLRGNPGGLKIEALDILGIFLPRYVGLVQATPLIKGGWKLSPERISWMWVTFRKPLVVLIDEKTGSSAEIVALALQEYGRAIVIGAPRSYGKGSVQTKSALKGNGTLVLTSNLWLGPSGRSVLNRGVTSDIPLRSTSKEVSYERAFTSTKTPPLVPPEGVPSYIPKGARANLGPTISSLHQKSQARLQANPIEADDRSREREEAIKILADYIVLEQNRPGSVSYVAEPK